MLLEDNIRDSIREINSDIEGYIGNNQQEEIFLLESISDGYNTVIEYLGIPLWSSEDDGRGYISSDLRETLNSYLRKEIRRLHDIIGRVEV